jgi:23S rRNA (uracil1939-C5)-methyltransferase
LRCTIEGISYDGAGVTRIKGKAVFIPFAIPDETVEIDIVEERNKYSTAKLREVVKPSPERVEPVCSYYYQCGGCSYQHIDYFGQLKYKRQVVVDNLTRIGKITVPVNTILGMECPWRYRNKVTWHVRNGRLGYYADNTVSLVPVDACSLITERLEEVSRVLARQLIQTNSSSDGEVVLRESSVNGDIMAVFRQIEVVPALVESLKPHCSSIYNMEDNRFKHIHGKAFLDEKINDISFRLSPGSFFQVNHRQTLILIAKVLEYLNLKGDENVLDAYCGIGSISLPLAKTCKSVLGVESFTAAVEDARLNAKLNNLANCEFLSGPCERVLPKLKRSFDAVVLDPPRAGCKRAAIMAITDRFPAKVVYVSCNPATLARDLAVFTEQGYRVKEVQPVDMFPWTRHVECVVLMSRL